MVRFGDGNHSNADLSVCRVIWYKRPDGFGVVGLKPHSNRTYTTHPDLGAILGEIPSAMLGLYKTRDLEALRQSCQSDDGNCLAQLGFVV